MGRNRRSCPVTIARVNVDLFFSSFLSTLSTSRRTKADSFGLIWRTVATVIATAGDTRKGKKLGGKRNSSRGHSRRRWGEIVDPLPLPDGYFSTYQMNDIIHEGGVHTLPTAFEHSWDKRWPYKEKENRNKKYMVASVWVVRSIVKTDAHLTRKWGHISKLSSSLDKRREYDQVKQPSKSIFFLYSFRVRVYDRGNDSYCHRSVQLERHDYSRW